MARRDYRFVGFEDEKTITEIMLRALPKVCRARVDREAWLDSLALSGPSGSSIGRVQGGTDVDKAQRLIEKKESDKVLGWLRLIEVRLCDKIQHLSQPERAVIREYYLTDGYPPDREVARKLKIKKGTVQSIRLRARNKMVRACTSVYHVFCLWREQDELDLDQRGGSELDKIIKEEAA